MKPSSKGSSNQKRPKIVQPLLSPSTPTSPGRKLPSLASLKPLIPEISQEIQQKSSQFVIPHLSSLFTSKPCEVEPLFIQKCQVCLHRYDFGEPKSTQFILAKEDVLQELVKSLSSSSFRLPQSEPLYTAAFSLIAFHIFRNPIEAPSIWFSVYDFFCLNDEILTPDWAHLSLIYDFAIALVSRDDFSLPEAGMLAPDLFKLSVFLCRSADRREQEKLTSLIALLFRKLKPINPFPIDVLYSALLRVSLYDDPFTSGKPLLTVLSKLVPHFKEPLKPKHTAFYHSIVLPLHRSSFFTYFYSPLYECTVRFIEKDHHLIVDLFKALIQYWPILQPQKQLLFLEEIAQLSGFVSSKWIKEVLDVLSPQIVKTIEGVHADVSLKALEMWNVNDFVWLVTQKPEVSYPTLLPGLFGAATSHWDGRVRVVATSVLSVMRENNRIVFDRIGECLRRIESNRARCEMEKADMWRYLIKKFGGEKRDQRLLTVSEIFIGGELFV